ncbi:Cutinase transcription factor 1 beta [Escovopsis weberi]|uniref:Cutinase transcription factor 1 beta n=1 Tax=Escovopsis weberi TaxID=150374 RepID=A0A0N0RT90_ESCWE|nr:Cutinase transcription factor 1 beta [Escovopsis weberi]
MMRGGKEMQGSTITTSTTASATRKETTEPLRDQSTPFGLKSVDAAAAQYTYAGSPAATFFPSIQECASPTFAPLPPFIRPLPAKIPSEDVSFLCAKGALSIPNPSLQNALLRAYIEFVHPFMPLLDLHPLLNVINCENGFEGQVSLFLYHAVMFSATAFVDDKHLVDAGYPTRKAARRAFFQKTRLLYDFDYESDRVVLIQGLLLMTYWYETPDDQKDTWHWMGVAVSLAHTIGLHRNMEMTSLAPATRRLWKRIWWSCFMRDRLVALGMRRPTRIKDEDFDVPMLAEADFEIEALPEHITLIGTECALVHSVEMQRELATMCVQKAKLCVCISDMLKTQYSVLIRDNMEPENTASSTMMLFPNKEPDSLDGVARVDAGLRAWAEALPASCHYRALQPRDARDGGATVAVQRTLLHMAYHTTVSALHRPQFLPSSPAQAPAISREVQEMSRLRVKEAAMRITAMATELHHLRLERYLPTTGVTFILPAMIIHLLEMKSPQVDARTRATRGFRQCMRVMGRLREIYASADYATGFLDAALRKAAIDINASIEPSTLAMMKGVPQVFSAQTPPPEGTAMGAQPSYVPQNAAEGPSKGLSEEGLPHSPSARQAASGSSAWLGRQDAPAPMMINTSVLDIDKTKSMAHSPPHTDDLGGVGRGSGSGPAGLTPRTANDSEGHPIDMDILDMDFSNGPHEIFDWNAISGTDLDLDQWLQFPAEGLNGEDMLF